MITKIDILNRLSVEFFKTFARTEYALKAAGYLKTGRWGEALPDWNRFATDIIDSFEKNRTSEVGDAIAFIVQSPPKTQAVINGKLVWAESTVTGDSTLSLSRHVRCIRNNLFHGGKFNGHWFSPDRSELLLKHGLVILEAFRNASPSVNAGYNG